jgi:hypothetical protein
LSMHRTADLCQGQSVLLLFQEADKLGKHCFIQTPASGQPDRQGRQRSMPQRFDTRPM